MEQETTAGSPSPGGQAATGGEEEGQQKQWGCIPAVPWVGVGGCQHAALDDELPEVAS